MSARCRGRGRRRDGALRALPGSWERERTAVCSGLLRQRQRIGDRAVGLAIEDQPHMAPCHLDAVGSGDDRALPVNDTVPF
jgi:hypothetical protein